MDGLLNAGDEKAQLFSEDDSGFTFYLDLSTVDAKTSERVRSVLRTAIEALGTATGATNKSTDGAHKKLDDTLIDAYGSPHDLSAEQVLEGLLMLNTESRDRVPDAFSQHGHLNAKAFGGS